MSVNKRVTPSQVEVSVQDGEERVDDFDASAKCNRRPSQQTKQDRRKRHLLALEYLPIIAKVPIEIKKNLYLYE